MQRAALAVLLALTLGGAAGAQIGETPVGETQVGDVRVREALEELELNYEIDADGDYKVIVEFEEGGRSQVAIINSRTETLRPLEIREVWSPAFISDRKLKGKVANRLLMDNFERKLGAWQILTNGDQQVAVFSVKLAADAAPASLLTTLEAVLTTADQMEKELLGTDDF